MSDTPASLRRKIHSAVDLQSVVRTMRALAASSIGQYEQSVRSLAEYYRTVEIGLGACLRDSETAPLYAKKKGKVGSGAIAAVVFGSDQGLVGQFNDEVVEFASQTLAAMPVKPEIWAVGERVSSALSDAGFPPRGVFEVPNFVKAITPLIGQILVQSATGPTHTTPEGFHLFYNRPKSGAAYAPVHQRLLPLDESWRSRLARIPWPTRNRPQIKGDRIATLRALVREYLFVSIFRACAESLASENASRLAAMQRADKNIDDLLESLNSTFRRSRQDGIDEELFDVISGYMALNMKK